MNGLINRMFALDTNTAINLINEKIPALPESEDSETQYCISVITEIELFAYPKITPEEEQDIRFFLEDVTIIPLTDEIKSETIRIRRSGIPFLLVMRCLLWHTDWYDYDTTDH
ncbi:hypothetical protein FACS1894140_5250 [Spirochaetia bacterium]|nr:hypothetical protein FACS1894140_5250 [Spirochaetia bacterium]